MRESDCAQLMREIQVPMILQFWRERHFEFLVVTRIHFIERYLLGFRGELWQVTFSTFAS